jgi:hypothetical protein
MARKNVSKVVDKFLGAQHGNGDSKRTIWTDGNTVYSYAMPIAHRANTLQGQWRFFVVKRSESPSRTTSMHISQVGTMMAASTIPMFSDITEVSLADLRLAMRGSEALEDVIIRNVDAKAA